MSSDGTEIRCMLIPLREGFLLLPNAAVAEVIGYREPEQVDEDLAWLQGMVSWHQRDVPVVDYERLLGRPQKSGGVRQRIVICYSLDSNSAWPLLGLVAQGIPRLLRVSDGSIEQAGHPATSNSPVKMRITINGDELVVPDLDHIRACLPAA